MIAGWPSPCAKGPVESTWRRHRWTGKACFRPPASRPYLRKRSVCIFPHNEAVDGPWYFNPAFWEAYFDKLSLNRFNAFSLTFGHQTAYLVPPYAFLVPMSEFPEVSVPSLTDEPSGNETWRRCR